MTICLSTAEAIASVIPPHVRAIARAVNFQPKARRLPDLLQELGQRLH
ncbi:hypothetical protein ACSBLW_12590 [Thioclava sp. FR2]